MVELILVDDWQTLDPDHMAQNMVFDLGLHYWLRHLKITCLRVSMVLSRSIL